MSELRTNRIIPRDGLTSGTGKGGGVIQVVHTNTSTLLNTTTANTDFDTHLTGTITPTRADSKIFITVSQVITVRSTASGNYQMALSLVRTPSGGSSTTIIDGTNGGNGQNIAGRSDGVSAYNFIQLPIHLNKLDEPATTSAVTYKTIARLLTSSTGTMKCQEDGVQSFMTLIEISG